MIDYETLQHLYYSLLEAETHEQINDIMRDVKPLNDKYTQILYSIAKAEQIKRRQIG